MPSSSARANRACRNAEVNDETLVGFVAMALVPAIAWRLWRGLSTGALPLYRTYLRREDDRAKFAALVGVHALSLIAIAWIAADLLLEIRPGF